MKKNSLLSLLFFCTLFVLITHSSSSGAEALPLFSTFSNVVTVSVADKEIIKAHREWQDVVKSSERYSQGKSHLFPNIAIPPPSTIDIEQLARQYGRQINTNRQDNLLIFASFTLPVESFKKLVQQASQTGATIILRGFKNNSITDTALAINKLNEKNALITVNPKAFDYFNIKVVPTIVLINSNQKKTAFSDKQATTVEFVSVSGDVSLDYALNTIADHKIEFKPLVDSYSARLKSD